MDHATRSRPALDIARGVRRTFAALVLFAGLPSIATVLAVPATESDRLAPLWQAIDRAREADDPLLLADTTLPRLAQLSADEREAVRKRLTSWDIGRRVAAWAFLQVGTPYELGPLGEEAPPDTDQVIAFTTTDCAVLNLVSAAMAHAADAGGERAAMSRANYRDGIISYATRFHFTTDRLDGSPYYRDITRRVGAMRQTVTLNKKADGGRWIPIEWNRTRPVDYVPRSKADQFAGWFDQKRIPAALGVAFVRKSMMVDGLDVVHESLLWKGRTLLHASSTTGRVVTLPWREYLDGPGRRHDGFVLFEYR